MIPQILLLIQLPIQISIVPSLANLYEGWQIGLPKIGVGGHIQLFIPSAYAWGCTGDGPVPANTPVFFDVQLLAVN